MSNGFVEDLKRDVSGRQKILLYGVYLMASFFRHDKIAIIHALSSNSKSYASPNDTEAM